MTSRRQIIVEIAAHCVQSAVAAQAGGADRVELFCNPKEGGVTPSEGTIAVVRDRLAIDLHVMIRPRGGNFYYSDAEVEIMLRDIETAKRLGANGVAFGLVNEDGTVDVKRTREMVGASRPMSVTFHRAFDVCKDLQAALNEVVSCGADRVLTSGGAATALKGIDRLTSLMEVAAHRITVMAAGHIRPENVTRVVQATGVREIHAGLRSVVPSQREPKNISFGSQPWFERTIVLERDVRQLIDQLEAL